MNQNESRPPAGRWTVVDARTNIRRPPPAAGGRRWNADGSILKPQHSAAVV